MRLMRLKVITLLNIKCKARAPMCKFPDKNNCNFYCFSALKMALSVSLWIFLVIVALVLLFAIFSNALVIYCVIKFPKLRSVTHVLICNLAVSDILLAGFVMPQKLHDLSHEEDFFEGE